MLNWNHKILVHLFRDTSIICVITQQILWTLLHSVLFMDKEESRLIYRIRDNNYCLYSYNIKSLIINFPDVITTEKESLIMQLKLLYAHPFFSTPFSHVLVTLPMLLWVLGSAVSFWWWRMLPGVVSNWNPFPGWVKYSYQWFLLHPSKST